MGVITIVLYYANRPFFNRLLSGRNSLLLGYAQYFHIGFSIFVNGGKFHRINHGIYSIGKKERARPINIYLYFIL